MRAEAGGAVPRLDRHLARLAGSAAMLGIPFAEHRARDALLRATRPGAPDEQQRLRLHVGADGTLSATATAFVLQPPATVWRLALARVRLDSRDPLRGHKSDRRVVYDRARSEYDSAEIDEVLLLNERGEIAEGTITSVFLDPGNSGGVLTTPPLASGCLPGIEREILLESGRARERRILPEDLRGARALFVGNSLRGLVRARLADKD